jgi:hypothetical protein
MDFLQRLSTEVEFPVTRPAADSPTSMPDCASKHARSPNTPFACLNVPVAILSYHGLLCADVQYGYPELFQEDPNWLRRARSPTLVVTDAGCLMHIAGRLLRQKKTRKVLHIAKVLNHK